MTDRTLSAPVRTRLGVTGAVLVLGALTAACGGSSGAPSDASDKDFCDAANSLIGDLIPKDATKLPSEEDMATSVQDWGARMEEVGTPEKISDEARKGFEVVVAQAQDIKAEDFSAEKLQDLEMGGADATAEEKKQAEAFGQYLTDTCGNPADDLELPDMGGNGG